MRTRRSSAALLTLLIFAAVASVFSAISESAADEPLRTAAVGDTFERYPLEDQHGAKHVLGEGSRLVLLSFDMDLSKKIHGWLEQKEPGYLASHGAQYAADITEMPGMVSFLFAKPKMRKYPFQILLADDDSFAPRFPKEDGKITAIQLDEKGTIASIRFLDSMDAVAEQLLGDAK